MIINIHRRKTPNRGDLASGPCVYFSDSDGVRFLDVLDCDGRDDKINSLIKKADLIIYGGGGLLDHEKFDASLRYLLDNFGDKVVIWGAGSNVVKDRQFKSNVKDCRFIGTRDWNGSLNDWLPCASCMSIDIDAVLANREVIYQGGIGILENNAGNNVASVHDCGLTVKKFGNKKVSTKEMLEFIMSVDVLISSSFHACYWATLLGVPVVGVPTSSKFYTLKHAIPLATKDTWPDYLSQTTKYPEALIECRLANVNFLESLKPHFESLTEKKFIGY